MPIHFGTDGWRAVISDEFTFANLRLVARAMAEYFLASAKEERSTVIVGYDSRAKALPEWLMDWTRTGKALRSTDAGCPLHLFSKPFPAGTVSLPGNTMVPGVGAMYVIGVIPQAATKD